jgi:hypothetical protein
MIVSGSLLLLLLLLLVEENNLVTSRRGDDNIGNLLGRTPKLLEEGKRVKQMARNIFVSAGVIVDGERIVGTGWGLGWREA